MKLRTTKKEIKENAFNILAVGYCELESLLKYESPFAYSAGVYGWSCDYYQFDGVVISTGYSPIGSRTDYQETRDVNKKASQLHDRSELRELIGDFVKNQINR